LETIREGGGALDAVLYCPHHPDEGCPCRKPRPGLVDQACRQLPIDLSRSYLVGDDVKDIALGHAVGCRTILVLSGRMAAPTAAQCQPPPHQICQDLRAAADWILAHPRDPR